MPHTSPGEAMPSVQKLARKRWYIFKHYNPGSAQDPRTAFIVAYLLGYRECLSHSAGFAGLPEQLARLAALLEDTSDWQDAVEQAVDDEDLSADELASFEAEVSA